MDKKNIPILKTVAILFFLMGLNFLNMFYYLAIITFFYVFLFSKSSQVNNWLNVNSVLILFFCIFYSLFFPSDLIESKNINMVIKIFSYFLGYLIGRIIINNDDAEEFQISNYIIIFALGTALLGTLTIFKNIKMFGIFGFERNMPSFWTNDLYGATAQSSLFLILSGISVYVLLILRKNLVLKFIVILGILLLLLNAFLNASRTALLYPIVSFFLSYFLYLLYFKNKNIKKVVLIIGVISVSFILYYNNILGIKSLVDNMPLFVRLNSEYNNSLIQDSRLGSYSFFIQHMSEYPFGGLNSINPILYMHNLWLDIYAVSGILAFIFSLLFSCGIIINITRLIRNREVSEGFKVLITGTFLSFFLLFMTEPVLLANPWFFIVFCIIGGMIDKYLDILKTGSAKITLDLANNSS